MRCLCEGVEVCVCVCTVAGEQGRCCVKCLCEGVEVCVCVRVHSGRGAGEVLHEVPV